MDFTTFIAQLDLFDRSLTLAINGCHTPFLDTFFYIFTQTWVWIPAAILLIALLIKQYGIKSLYILLAISLVILLADQVSSSIIKPLVQRPRPTHNIEIEDIVHVVNGYRGGAYGFVSSHAANSIAFLFLTSMFFRRRIYAVCFTMWAILTCYSRIYLGVHYLGDILCGALIGFISAIIIYYLFKLLFKAIKNSKFRFNSTRFNNSYNILMSCSLILTAVIILIYSASVNIF